MPTLRSLCEALGPSVELLDPQVDADAELVDIALVGHGEPLPRQPGTVAVCAGTPTVESGRTPGAVVLREQDVDAAVRALGCAVLVAADGTPVHHLLAVVATVLSGTVATPGLTGDLFDLANTVAAMVGGAVLIEDAQRTVLAYSTLPGQRVDPMRQEAILGRQLAAAASYDEYYQELRRRRDVLRVDVVEDLYPRIATAVRSGPEVLGYLWVIEGDDVPADAQERLAEGAELVAVHLLRARAGRGVERRARGELLRQLFDGSMPADLAASRLGIDPGAAVTVVGFTVPAAVAERDVGAQAVADLVLGLCAAVAQRSAVLLELGTAYALVPSAGLDRRQLVSLASSACVRSTQALGVTMAAAVGSTVDGLWAAAASRADADAVLRLAAPGSVLALEDVLPAVALSDLANEVARNPHLSLPAVEALLAHDAEHATPYADTVLALLAAQHDVVAASAHLGIHQNTFRYRLRRARELFGLDLDDPDVRLLTWLRLRTAG